MVRSVRGFVARSPRLAAAVRRLRWGYPRPGRQGIRRWLPSWRQLLTLVVGTLGLLTGVIAFAYERTQIPTDLNSFATQQDNVYYWADGTEMGRTGQVNRQALPLSKVPASVQWAVLSAENATFYTDSGVSPSGMLRAVYEMVQGRDTQGGSTITQQYVKNAYLNRDQTLSRKISEIFIAIKLDSKLSKQQILENYLNTSWFGRGTYGIARAAQAYYGKDVSQLDPSQAAFMATLLKGAGDYDPAISRANHDRAKVRWAWVLDRMVANGELSAAQRAKYTVFPEPIEPKRTIGLSGQTGYLVETAKAYTAAHTKISPAQFDLGGYQIYTTFDKPKEKALTSAVQNMKSGLKPEQREADRNVRVGAASVVPDGRIVALYGGEDYLKQGFNDANAATVPAGSAFTPFVYAAALRDGVQLQRGAARTPVTPDTVYNGDDKVPVKTPEGPYWDRGGKMAKTANDGGKSWGRISLREAMAQSVNGPYTQLGMDVGLDHVGKAAVDAGLLPDTLGAQVPAFALGNSTPSVIRMADAYGTFAAGGTHTEPYSVLRIVHGGAAVSLDKPAVTQPFSPQIAGAVTQALEGAVQRGSATAARDALGGTTTRDGQVAGKTGTVQDNTSAWFVGYTKHLSTAVSLFRVDPKTQLLVSLDGLGGAPTGQFRTDWPATAWADYEKAVG
ncbi:transglycosylase domain-containing protein [Streptomyces ferralitis]|uniref:Transglycosylase domain-containing protein n=2 Tax=Streptantibioticus ferralitis TaxID=236510 RepID=A0ABT5YVX6_9ACTN|nr:transglycosylase domain-containing protein [Streptantibioticus ferralitis]MDF2255628.1 transglycosylase domain-containing protein [Streptantibioticus ferralitis]